jgi:hypothetical protein
LYRDYLHGMMKTYHQLLAFFSQRKKLPRRPINKRYKTGQTVAIQKIHMLVQLQDYKYKKYVYNTT